MIKNTNVRFFSYCLDDNNEVDITEINEGVFLTLSGKNDSKIEYERDTIFTNGVDQVRLIVEPVDYPTLAELEGEF